MKAFLKSAVLLFTTSLAFAGAGAEPVDVVKMPQGQTSLVMVPIGNPDNKADPSTGNGQVPYSYKISKCDVTVGQYTAFLNTVASTSDPYKLYNSGMSSLVNGKSACGITRSGDSGSYTYTAARDPNYPVNFTSWGDAARFCNWLTNNQPVGPEGSSTTETGSYTLKGATSDAALLAVKRNDKANYVIPTENEWYKAAYYNGDSSSYYLYPTRSNSQPSNIFSAKGTNNANYYRGEYTDSTNYLTAVAAFAGSASPYGTYDQGGNVFQWNESVVSGLYRGLRGGAYKDGAGELKSDNTHYASSPSSCFDYIGFRICQVSESKSTTVPTSEPVGAEKGKRPTN